LGEVLADLGFEPLVKGVQRRHKVTVTIKGWRKPNKPKGYEATPESATAWLHVACVGYLLTKV
jgi:hypothetical protein